MARLGRHFLPDEPLHVIQRGNNRDIELNPVHARPVRRPRHYRWSSYHAHAQGATEPLPIDRAKKRIVLAVN